MKKILIKLCLYKKSITFRKIIFWILCLCFWKKPFTFLGEGRHRRVYRHGNYVIKIPLSYEGLASNDKEAKTYQCTTDGWLFGIRYARCRLYSNGFLIMEYVESTNCKFLPDWVNYIDCQQVGYNRKG